MEYLIHSSEGHIITSFLHSPAPDFRYKLVAKNIGMASYLLLRNNKETGPYTLEALIELGLKPYDLVWVEGKSAAWRYPSEVEGLKFYAPVVEEQPFDRFFKKPPELKSEIKEQKPVVQEKIQVLQLETKSLKDQESIAHNDEENFEFNNSKKQVYVSMPVNGGKTVIIKKSEQVAATTNAGNNYLNDSFSKNKETFPKQESVINSNSQSYSELGTDYNKHQYTEKKVPVQKVEIPVNDEYPLERKYSQALDDIKNMYAQTLANRKRKNAQKQIITNLAKKVLPFAVVLIIGMLIGIFIMNNKNGNETVTQAAKSSLQNTTGVSKPNTSLINTSQVQQPVAENKQFDFSTSSQEKNLENEQNISLTTLVSNTKKITKKDSKQNTTSAKGSEDPSQPKNIEPDPVTGERNKIVRQDNDNNAPSVEKQFKTSLMKQVRVTSNDYKRGTFGGIHDLQITVTNNSNYLLDNVIVELEILKPNDRPLKSDKIRFSPVPPNGSLTLAIPATSRGVKVAYKVVQVESKSALNETAGLK